MSYSIFINYRRDDSSGESKLIRDALVREFGERRVFMDVDSIKPGQDWPSRLRSRMQRAETVIMVIGPNWLQAGLNQWAMRRIDDPSDWVRRELEAALKHKKKIIPVLVRGAEFPPVDVLPRVLSKLPRKQCMEIRSECWDHDVLLLLARLSKEDRPGHVMHEGVGPYPKSSLTVPPPIPKEKLKSILPHELPRWKSIETPLPEDPATKRVELFREFTFTNFNAVIQFMAQVARGCSDVNHHPRWENIFKTLRVYLSTWDKKLHQVTDRDLQLARYFDGAFARFPGRAKKRKQKRKGV